MSPSTARIWQNCSNFSGFMRLHAETSMAIEMAHALGAIDIGEHQHYVTRLDRIYQAQAEAFLIDIRRSAP